MKPVLLSLCLVLLFMAGMASASLSDCPTCVFGYDGNGLSDANPYAGCPTCVFSYDSSGNLISGNPYAGCPTCVFAYDSNGFPIPNTDTGCSSCGSSYGTTNTIGTCTSCSFISSVSPSGTTFTILAGTHRTDFEQTSRQVRSIVLPTSSLARPNRFMF
jgi:hypothetical protein